jgi:hypothetical protein
VVQTINTITIIFKLELSGQSHYIDVLKSPVFAFIDSVDSIWSKSWLKFWILSINPHSTFTTFCGMDLPLSSGEMWKEENLLRQNSLATASLRPNPQIKTTFFPTPPEDKSQRQPPKHCVTMDNPKVSVIPMPLFPDGIRCYLFQINQSPLLLINTYILSSPFSVTYICIISSNSIHNY